MSDGGKAEGEREKRDLSIPSGANQFGREISRIAVAQVCDSIKFEGFNESALDSLADIAIRYICDLGKAARFYANSSGRTQCNVFDIIQGLEDLSMPLGFNSTNSGAIKEIMEYVETAEEIPFAQPVPRFPVIRESKMIPSFLQMGETPSFNHIPPWLPAFPDPHTYIQTSVWNERISDPRTDKIELSRQHTKAERSLLNLQQRLVCNGSSSVSVAAQQSSEPEDDDEVPNRLIKENGFDNPFLAKPFKASEKAVVLSVNQPKNLSGEANVEKRISLLDTFAPAIEAMKDGLDSGSDGDKIYPEKRASIFLELKGGKKGFGESMDLKIRNRSVSEKTAAWFGRDDEKDDKRRRVEFILRKSMENQQELPQL